MAFMEIERYDGHFVLIDLGYGETAYVPEPYAEGTVIETVFGYGCRLSAPGYLDCTDWDVYNTEAEADARAAELEAESDALLR